MRRRSGIRSRRPAASHAPDSIQAGRTEVNGFGALASLMKDRLRMGWIRRPEVGYSGSRSCMSGSAGQRRPKVDAPGGRQDTLRACFVSDHRIWNEPSLTGVRTLNGLKQRVEHCRVRLARHRRPLLSRSHSSTQELSGGLVTVGQGVLPPTRAIVLEHTLSWSIITGSEVDARQNGPDVWNGPVQLPPPEDVNSRFFRGMLRIDPRVNCSD